MYSLRRGSHVEEVTINAQSDCAPKGQSDYLADLPLYPLCASLAPAHTRHTKAMSRLQKSVLANPKTHASIYILEDPRNGQVRYVGQTKTLRQRYYDHCISGSNGVRAWVLKLRAQGLRPSLHVIEVVKHRHIKAREYYWIRFFSKHFRLLNTMYLRGRKPLVGVDHTLPLFARKK
ncbi:MAG: GIY-YIG nuclease family protein [Nitrospira defluvii]|nr:GIY-YIG nuclease family protein [Nitrospira defluvii]